MSRVLAVFAHPSHTSFNHAVLCSVVEGLHAKGHEVQVADLYAQRFDPALTATEIAGGQRPATVVREQERVTWAELLILLYPIWWWGPPAILKGWLERVLSLGYAFRYDLGSNGYRGLLTGRRAAVICTGSADPRTYPHTWQAQVQEQLVPEILRTAGIHLAGQLTLAEIHQYAPPERLRTAIDTVGEFARTL